MRNFNNNSKQLPQIETLDTSGKVTDVCFSSGNNPLLASCSYDGTIRIWHQQDSKNSKGNSRIYNENPQILTGQNNGMNTVSFSSGDNPLLASGSDDGTIRIWYLKVSEDSEGNSRIYNENPQVLRGQNNINWTSMLNTGVKSVSFSSGIHPLLASGGFDKTTIRIWHQQDSENSKIYNENPQILTGHKDTVTSVAFSSGYIPLLASGSHDGIIRIWRQEDSENNIIYYKKPQLLTGHKCVVDTVTFSSGENPLLASGSLDGSIRIWYQQDSNNHIDSGRIYVIKQILTMKDSHVYRVAFSSGDNPLLASVISVGSYYSGIMVWHLQELDDNGIYKYNKLPQVLESNYIFNNSYHFAFSSDHENHLLASISTNEKNIYLRKLPMKKSLSNTPSSIPASSKMSFSPKNLLSNKTTQGKTQLREKLNELDNLVGLHEVKTAAALFGAFMSVRPRQAISDWNNIALEGPPGTGKTLVARLLAKIIEAAGLVRDNSFVEMSISDLKAGYVGKTFDRTMKFLKAHRGSVLFLDEAHTLFAGGQDYGREAASAMIKFLEGDRIIENTKSTFSTVIIIAGNVDALEKGFIFSIIATTIIIIIIIMKGFWAADEGLKRRFPHKFKFKNYNSTELAQILLLRIKNTPNLKYSDDQDIPEKLTKLIENNYGSFVGTELGDAGLLNGGGMEVLLQRAQFCRAAEMSGVELNNQWDRNIDIDMELTYANFESGMLLITGEPTIITLDESLKGTVSEKDQVEKSAKVTSSKNYSTTTTTDNNSNQCCEHQSLDMDLQKQHIKTIAEKIVLQNMMYENEVRSDAVFDRIEVVKKKIGQIADVILAVFISALTIGLFGIFSIYFSMSVSLSLATIFAAVTIYILKCTTFLSWLGEIFIQWLINKINNISGPWLWVILVVLIVFMYWIQQVFKSQLVSILLILLSVEIIIVLMWSLLHWVEDAYETADVSYLVKKSTIDFKGDVEEFKKRLSPGFELKEEKSFNCENIEILTRKVEKARVNLREKKRGELDLLVRNIGHIVEIKHDIWRIITFSSDNSPKDKEDVASRLIRVLPPGEDGASELLLKPVTQPE